VFEGGDGKGATRDAQQADGLALELVESAVVEGVLQDAGVRSVVHGRSEQHGVGVADPPRDGRAVALIAHVRIQRWQVERPEVEEVGVGAGVLGGVEGTSKRESRVTVRPKAARNGDDSHHPRPPRIGVGLTTLTLR